MDSPKSNNQIIVTHVRRDVKQRQSDWGDNVQSLTCCYSCQYQRPTGILLFILLCTRKRPVPVDVVLSSAEAEPYS